MPRKSDDDVNASFHKGLTNKEIAQKFNLTPGAVRNRRNRWKAKTLANAALVRSEKNPERVDTPSDELAQRRKLRSQTPKIEVMPPAGGETSAEPGLFAAIFDQLGPGEPLNMSQVKQLITAAVRSSVSSAEMLAGLNTYLRALQVEQTLPVKENKTDELKMTAEETADRILRILRIS